MRTSSTRIDKITPGFSDGFSGRPPAKSRIASKNFGAPGTKPSLQSSSSKCSNLARGESIKDLVGVFGCRRGFHFGHWRRSAVAMRTGGVDALREQIAAFPD